MPGDDERNFLGSRGVGLPIRQARTFCSLTRLPSQLRSTDSRTRRMETGRRDILPNPSFSQVAEIKELRLFPMPGIEAF